MSTIIDEKLNWAEEIIDKFKAILAS